MSNPILTLRSKISEFFAGVDVTFDVSLTTDLRHGDLTTNAAMAAFSSTDNRYTSPSELADKIVEHLQKDGEVTSIFSKIEVAGPGFINFFYSDIYLESRLEDVLESKDIVGVEKVEKSRKELIENTQPNTNKPLHIGHLRNTALGESIVRLRREVGEDSISVNLNNDRGIHIVKAMWAYLQFGRGSNTISDWGNLIQEWSSDQKQWSLPENEGEKADVFVGRYYVLGDKAEKEQEEKVKIQLSEMLQAWEDGDTEVRALWKQMNEWFYEGFKKTHGRFLGIGEGEEQFVREWYESEIYEEGKKIVLESMDKGIFEKRDDGAVMARLEKYNLPDKVVIRSDGTSVYMTQDLALARDRIQEGFDFTAYVVGSEQELHFKQLFVICEALGIGRKENFRHISYGMVNLAGGRKMSSREGTVVTADSLMDTVKEKLAEHFDTKDEETLEKVMLGAIKYWMLRYNPHQEIHFDIDESVSVSGNSGPYILYTYARVQSLMSKSEKESGLQNIGETEKNLVRDVMRFPGIVRLAADSFSPNLMAEYLYNLASSYNTYYQKNKIVGSAEEEMRLAVSVGVAKILQQGLGLLGIETVERM